MDPSVAIPAFCPLYRTRKLGKSIPGKTKENLIPFLPENRTYFVPRLTLIQGDAVLILPKLDPVTNFDLLSIKVIHLTALTGSIGKCRAIVTHMASPRAQAHA